MTLTTRLSLFFLTTLALVLGGFSVALYLLAGVYLHRQAEERLDAVLNTLAAAVEVGPEGVEWEPGQRPVQLGPAIGDQPVWLVQDDKGREVDRSGRADAAAWLAEEADDWPDGDAETHQRSWRGERWHVGRRVLRPPPPGSVPPAPTEPGDTNPKYARLTILAGGSLEPVAITLRLLGGTLAGLSAAVWLLALFAGRVVCRRSLRPLTRMTDAARAMDPTDPAGRLPAIRTGDELEDLGRSFNALLDRLQESFERQRRFTGEASHQLRTPLAAILGQVEVALRRDRPTEEYRQTLTTVHERAGHLHRIVEALLFLTRADAEAALPGRERLNLAEWLSDRLQSLADRPRSADTALEADGRGAWVDAHPILLGELLDILLDNAWKYSEPGTPVRVGLRPVGDAVEVSVRDQGAGIAEEDLPHLFTPFFRSAGARRRGVDGLGLGLAIARRLAHACGGTLTAESKPGHGSCFTLRLPSADARNTSATHPS